MSVCPISMQLQITHASSLMEKQWSSVNSVGNVHIFFARVPFYGGDCDIKRLNKVSMYVLRLTRMRSCECSKQQEDTVSITSVSVTLGLV